MCPVISFDLSGFWRTWILKAVIMKNTIFCDIPPCSPLKVNQHFGRTLYLHLQGRISQARYQCESGWQGIIFCLFDPDDGGNMFLQNVGLHLQQITLRYIPENSTLSGFCLSDKANVIYFWNGSAHKHDGEGRLFHFVL
jgi:hypothetical protein